MIKKPFANLDAGVIESLIENIEILSNLFVYKHQKEIELAVQRYMKEIVI